MKIRQYEISTEICSEAINNKVAKANKIKRSLLSLAVGLFCMQIGVAHAEVTESKVCYFKEDKYLQRYPKPVVYWKVVDGELKINLKDVKPKATINKGLLQVADVTGTILIPHSIRKWCKLTTRTWTLLDTFEVLGRNGRTGKVFTLTSTKLGKSRTPIDLICYEPLSDGELSLLGMKPKNAALPAEGKQCTTPPDMANINKLLQSLGIDGSEAASNPGPSITDPVGDDQVVCHLPKNEPVCAADPFENWLSEE